MLKNITKKLEQKIATIVLASSLLFSQGCTTYKNLIPVDSIKSVESSGEYQFYLYERMTSEEAIKTVKTPEQVLDYLKQKLYYKDENNSIEKGEYQSFKWNNIDRKGVCFDYSIAAAALLSDNCYPPLVLLLLGKEENHSVFLFKKDNYFYALGNTSTFPEKSSTIKELSDKLSANMKIKWDNYLIINLDREYPNKEWIYGEKIYSKFILNSDLISLK